MSTSASASPSEAYIEEEEIVGTSVTTVELIGTAVTTDEFIGTSVTTAAFIGTIPQV